ncbi:unnamed protein product, partial [marine sediment metagenome]
NEEEVYQMVRKMMGYLPSNNMETPPSIECKDDPNR